MKDEDVKDKCETCRFWRENAITDDNSFDIADREIGLIPGRCRRRSSPWEDRVNTDWCGEYEKFNRATA